MMKVLKKMGKALLFPHPACMALLVVLSASMLIYSFVFLEQLGIVNYVSYFLSAYSLVLLCIRTPQMIRFFRSMTKSNRYIYRYITEPQLRVNISLYSSLAINTAYVVMQLGLGFYHRSVWFYSLAGYYMVLAVIRFFLLRYTRSHTASEDVWIELLHYRLCGVLLLFMNLVLSVIIIYITLQNRGFRHHYITTIAMAAYTFFSLTMAIINVIKYRKWKSPALSAAQAISLAAALVSVLTLETAMLTAFGEEGQENFRLIMTGATGVCVNLLIFAMAIYMITSSTKRIKAMKAERDPDLDGRTI